MKTKTALVELLKESRDSREFFKGCCEYSALRLRAQAYRFRDELTSMGHVAPLDEVQDTLFVLSRNLFPKSPAADFVTWAGLLCDDAIARLGGHYANLSPKEKEAADISGAWEHNEAIVGACTGEDLEALREAIQAYEDEAYEALTRAREESGAA
jgi:hypothetical protein